MPLVLTAEDQSSLGIYGNALPIAPVMIVAIAALDGVTHGHERMQGLSRKARLNINDVRQVLLVKPRGVHRLLDIQAAIGRAQKDIGNCRDDTGSARRADYEANLVVLEHNDGRHAG